MRKIGVIICLMLVLMGCKQTEKCEHTHTKTVYSEGDWFAIDKAVVCDDCMQTIANESLQAVEYVYNKKFINTDGITVTLDKIVVDSWGSIVMKFSVVGTANSGRTFSVEKMYLNDVDVNGWLYVSDIKDNKKAIEDVILYNGITAEELFASQDYVFEIEYEISNADTYKKLKSDSVSFNLNEYTMIQELKE